MSKPKFPKDFGKVSSKKADVFGDKFESLAHHAEDRPDLPSEWGSMERAERAIPKEKGGGGMTPDSETATFTHFRCQSCGYTGIISAQEIEKHRSRCAYGTTEPLLPAQEDEQKCGGCRLNIDHFCWDNSGKFKAGETSEAAPEAQTARTVCPCMVSDEYVYRLHTPDCPHHPQAPADPAIPEDLRAAHESYRAEEIIAELAGALQSLVDSIEDAGGHDENGDVFDITEACAALARAKEASRE